MLRIHLHVTLITTRLFYFNASACSNYFCDDAEEECPNQKSHGKRLVFREPGIVMW